MSETGKDLPPRVSATSTASPAEGASVGSAGSVGSWGLTESAGSAGSAGSAAPASRSDRREPAIHDPPSRQREADPGRGPQSRDPAGARRHGAAPRRSLRGGARLRSEECRGLAANRGSLCRGTLVTSLAFGVLDRRFLLVFAGVIAAWIGAALLASVRICLRQGWESFLRLPAAFACQHFGYGVGQFAGALDVLLSLRPGSKSRPAGSR